MALQKPHFMSGYLFKRSHNNTFKKWNRRWFTLINSKLFYQRKNDYNAICQIEPDLRVCKIREVNDVERRFTFEIVSPKCKHLLQADSQQECSDWIRSIDSAINYALNNSNKISNSQIADASNNISLTNSDGISYNESIGEFPDAVEFFHLMNQDLNNSSNNTNNSFANLSSKSLKENNDSSNEKSFEFTRKKSELSERKNYILTSLKGNQNCCDCGAPNPSWVNIHFIRLNEISVFNDFSG